MSRRRGSRKAAVAFDDDEEGYDSDSTVEVKKNHNSTAEFAFREFTRYVVPATTVLIVIGLLALIVYWFTQRVIDYSDAMGGFELYYSNLNDDSGAYVRALHTVQTNWDTDTYGPIPFVPYDCSSAESALKNRCNNMNVPSLVFYPNKNDRRNPIVYSDDIIDTHHITTWMNEYNSHIEVQ